MDVDEVIRSVPRENFLPSEVKAEAVWDMPLPIGHGQTNSQPYTVRLMLMWLDVKPGQKVLDVGSGSGWTSALLARLVGAKGKVIAVEKVPELVTFGRENCERLKIKNITFHEAGKRLGWPDDAPYDLILVSAAATELPEELINQLKPGGRMVIPIKSSVLVVDKKENGELEVEENSGFAFVPLI